MVQREMLCGQFGLLQGLCHVITVKINETAHPHSGPNSRLNACLAALSVNSYSFLLQHGDLSQLIH